MYTNGTLLTIQMDGFKMRIGCYACDWMNGNDFTQIKVHGTCFINVYEASSIPWIENDSLVLFVCLVYRKREDENCLPQTNGIRYQWEFFLFFFLNDFCRLFISFWSKVISVWCWKCIFILFCRALGKHGWKCTFKKSNHLSLRNSNISCTIESLKRYKK